MIIERESHAEFHVGSATVNQTPVQLVGPGYIAYSAVELAADSTNSDVVYIGHANVSSSNGYPLAAGEKLKLKVTDPSKIWLIGGDDGQVVKWLMV